MILLITLFGLSVTTSRANLIKEDKIVVYIFLHESCIICQYYTLPLKKLHEKYKNKNLQFVGLFPNFSSKPDKIKQFKKKFQISFELETDYFHTKKEKFGVTVTPEVIVYNESEEKIIYKGRIDDAYARVGKKKRITTTSELENVLNAIVNDQPVLIDNTQAVGCFIGKSKFK